MGGAKSNVVGLHIVTGHTPVPPPVVGRCSIPRCPMPSRPSFSENGSGDMPSSTLLMASLCAAWHDIGDRTSDILGVVQAKAKLV